MSIVEKYWDDAQEGDEAITPSYTVTCLLYTSPSPRDS